MKKRTWMWLVVVLLPSTAAAAGMGQTPTAAMGHRMMLLVIQLGLIIFAAKLGSMLFERLRLPGPLGELAAGILIGPYALGFLTFPGFPHGLFPLYGSSALSPELNGFCAVAAVVLLFTVGLETDIGLLLRYSVAGVLVGLGGVVASFGLGAGVVMVFSEQLEADSSAERNNGISRSRGNVAGSFFVMFRSDPTPPG